MLSKITNKWHPEEDRTFQSLQGLRVLVVDDNDDSLLLVRIILEEYGIEVRTATSVSEALAAIAQVLPDILISDIAMPGEDGYSLICKIRTLPPQQGGLLPAIAMTACVAEEERTRAIDAGFQLHLSKPIEPAELLVRVAELVRCLQYENQVA